MAAVRCVQRSGSRCSSQESTSPSRLGAGGCAGPQGVQGAQGPAGPSHWNAIPNKPAGFADGVDDAGVTSVKLTRVVGSTVNVPAGALGTAFATCPAGSRVTGGGLFSSSTTDFNLAQSAPNIPLVTWFADGRNSGAANISLVAYAVCMTVEPAGAFTIAKKGLLPASVKKAMKKRGR